MFQILLHRHSWGILASRQAACNYVVDEKEHANARHHLYLGQSCVMLGIVIAFNNVYVYIYIYVRYIFFWNKLYKWHHMIMTQKSKMREQGAPPSKTCTRLNQNEFAGCRCVSPYLVVICRSDAKWWFAYWSGDVPSIFMLNCREYMYRIREHGTYV